MNKVFLRKGNSLARYFVDNWIAITIILFTSLTYLGIYYFLFSIMGAIFYITAPLLIAYGLARLHSRPIQLKVFLRFLFLRIVIDAAVFLFVFLLTFIEVALTYYGQDIPMPKDVMIRTTMLSAVLLFAISIIQTLYAWYVGASVVYGRGFKMQDWPVATTLFTICFLANFLLSNSILTDEIRFGGSIRLAGIFFANAFPLLLSIMFMYKRKIRSIS
jgi:hypothetical protein